MVDCGDAAQRDDVLHQTPQMRRREALAIAHRSPAGTYKGRMMAVRHESRVLNDPLVDRVESMATDDDMYDDDEPRPLPDTLACARDLLAALRSTITRLGLQDAHISPFDGSVRFDWVRGPRSITIVVPASAANPGYVYYRDDGQHSLEPDPNSQRLTTLLTWLVTGDPIFPQSG